MGQLPRHQCLIYDGSPTKVLPAIAAQISQKLSENVRCLYLNSPIMVAGIKSFLYAAGVDVAYEMARASLILSSQSHLKNGRFDIDTMLHALEETLSLALADGYKGLWVSGDITWEFGSVRNLEKLFDYECRLDKFLHKHPALSGVCQYHVDTLPPNVVCDGALTHPAFFINETLSQINPYFVSLKAGSATETPNGDLNNAINELTTRLQRDVGNEDAETL